MFVLEGDKIVLDTLNFNPRLIDQLFATPNWLNKYSSKEYLNAIPNVFTAEPREIRKISSFKTTPEVLAILHIQHPDIDENEITSNLTLVLDNVQDPGNMGNIIRIADWFGIRNIICSTDCADCYNPKVVQASMGAIIRVNIHYTSIENFLKKMSSVADYKIYGTLLDGTSIYSVKFNANGAVIMGNESRGISSTLIPYINESIFIPSHNQRSDTVESLNVAAATAIVCSEFRRRSS